MTNSIRDSIGLGTLARRRSTLGLHSLWMLCALALLCFLPMGCRSSAPAAPLGTYYTRFPMNVDCATVRSTNYRGGLTAVLLPINTQVELLSTRGHRSSMRVADGMVFRFEHIAKHTQDTAPEAFADFFSSEPTDLSGFSEAEREAIAKGLAEVGMTRQAVLAAMGPPPAVGTLGQDSKVWKYWSTRWETFNVVFDEDGRVSAVGQ